MILLLIYIYMRYSCKLSGAKIQETTFYIKPASSTHSTIFVASIHEKKKKEKSKEHENFSRDSAQGKGLSRKARN